MNGWRTALIATAVLGCMTTACSKKAASDQALVTDIQAKLYGDAVTKPANVTVAAQNGVVTLSGDVPNSDVELEAMKVANGTAGVSGVKDQMKVNASMAANLPPAGPAGPPQPASGAPASYPPVSSAPDASPSQPTPPPASAPPPPPMSAAPVPEVPASVTIPAGERVSVRMIDSISSAQNTAGQVFRASLYGPLVSHGRVIVRAGAPVSVLLADAKGAGRIKGSSELEVRLSRLEYRGHSYPLQSSVYEEVGKGRGKNTAVRTGIGAGIGAAIGAIAGGGKGAAIGSAVGGGAGFGSDALTHGQQVKIPSETVLTFRLEAPLTVIE